MNMVVNINNIIKKINLLFGIDNLKNINLCQIAFQFISLCFSCINLKR